MKPKYPSNGHCWWCCSEPWHQAPAHRLDLYVFWLFIFTTTAFCRPENANLWKPVLKCKFLKKRYWSRLCVNEKNMNLWNGDVLRVQSIGVWVVCFFRECHRHILAWQQNAAFLNVFTDPCEQDNVYSVVVCIRKKKKVPVFSTFESVLRWTL